MQKNLKRASAMILSLAMAVQFGLTDSYYIKANDEQPDAEETTTNSDETATSFSMMLAENANDTYGVELRSQNNSSLGTLSLNVGAIIDNFKDGKITLNDKTYSFVEARVIKKSNPTDYTPISYVAVYNGVTYYSTNSITGSPLEAGESIVVILKEDVTQYAVNYKLIVDGVDKTANISDYITLEGNETSVDTDTSFSFLVKPKKGFTVTSVKQDDTTLTADGTKYSTNNITAKTTVKIELEEKKEASIRLSGSNTTFVYNGTTAKSDHSNWVIDKKFDTNTNSLSFELIGRLEWTQENDRELNKVAVSLHDGSTYSLSKKSINIPTTPGQSVETQLTDDLKAIVRKGTDREDIGNGAHSYRYSVTFSSEKNIYDDIDISTNFKDATNHELFVTSTVGVSTIVCTTPDGNQNLDPANSDSNFLGLTSGYKYTFKFSVLSGYIPDASKISVNGTVDGKTLDDVKVTKQSDGSFSFKITAVQDKYDYRIQVVATKSQYKLAYDAKGIDSSSKLNAGEHATITSKKPKNDGYVFNGWTIKGDPSETIYSSNEVVNIDDLISYSSWDATDGVSKITFVPTWLKANEAKSVGYTVLVHFDDGAPDREYDARTAPNKSVKVFKNELEASLGIDLNKYYLDSDQAFDMKNVKDGDVLEVTYHVRKELEVGNLSNVPYSGKSQQQKPVVKDGEKVLKESQDYTLSYSKDTTNAGTVTVTVTGTGNYSGTKAVKYQILKRSVTLTSEGGTKPYDGTALTKPAVKVSGDGFVKDEVSDIKATGSVTTVSEGEVTNTITFTKKNNYKDGNYSITKKEGTLTVTPKSIVPDGTDTPEEKKTGITVTKPSDSKYDGEEHKNKPTVTDTKTDKVLVEGKDYELSYSKDVTNAGIVTVTVTGKGNYEESFEVTYKITKRNVTLTSADASKTYDGKALTNTSITVSGDGFVEGEGAEYKVTGTQTQVGKSANEFEYTLNENTLASNYDITKVVGTLTVTAAPAPETPEKPAKPRKVKTGLQTNTGIFMVAGTLALAGLGVCLVLARRKRY